MQPTYNSNNRAAQPVDGPFAKLAQYLPARPNYLGIPPTGNIDSATANTLMLQAAAEALGLTNLDSDFVAKRILHLDFIVRNSKFAAAATWRSSLNSPQTANITFDSTVPYYGDCVAIRNAILDNKDLVFQLTKAKPSYYLAMSKDNPVEDTIAAFILAVDEA